MKDQYVGDISDYFKYAFLRRAQDLGARVVVCWMLTEPDGGPDGKKRRYLGQPDKFRAVDPDLFDALTEIDRAGSHSVAAVEKSDVLRGAPCMNAIFPDEREARAGLMTELEQTLLSSGGEVVFFDPDNGLETQRKKIGHKDSSKFLYLDEVAQAARAGRSVIVYQHLGQRHMPREEFLPAQLERVVEATRGAYDVFALEGPQAAALCAELPERHELMGAAESLDSAWPGDKARILRAS